MLELIVLEGFFLFLVSLMKCVRFSIKKYFFAVNYYNFKFLLRCYEREIISNEQLLKKLKERKKEKELFIHFNH